MISGRVVSQTKKTRQEETGKETTRESEVGKKEGEKEKKKKEKEKGGAHKNEVEIQGRLKTGGEMKIFFEETKRPTLCDCGC